MAEKNEAKIVIALLIMFVYFLFFFFYLQNSNADVNALFRLFKDFIEQCNTYQVGLAAHACK